MGKAQRAHADIRRWARCALPTLRARVSAAFINAASLLSAQATSRPVSTSGVRRAAQNHDHQMSKTVRTGERKRGECISEIQTGPTGVDRQGDDVLVFNTEHGSAISL